MPGWLASTCNAARSFAGYRPREGTERQTRRPKKRKSGDTQQCGLWPQTWGVENTSRALSQLLQADTSNRLTSQKKKRHGRLTSPPLPNGRSNFDTSQIREELPSGRKMCIERPLQDFRHLSKYQNLEMWKFGQGKQVCLQHSSGPFKNPDCCGHNQNKYHQSCFNLGISSYCKRTHYNK